MMERTLDEEQFVVTDLRPSEYLIVRSETFGDCHGYVQELFHQHDFSSLPDVPPMVTVRLDLPDDHPAVQDALADNPGRDSDWLEFVDIVPGNQLERISGEEVRFWTRAITSKERAARARSRGFTRLSLPELDTGLRR